MPQQQHSSDAEISRTFGRIAVVAILAACVIAILILTPSPAQTETAADNDTFLPLVQYELSPLVDLPIPQVVDSYLLPERIVHITSMSTRPAAMFMCLCRRDVCRAE